MPRPKLIASVLSADQSRLAGVCAEVDKAGLDGIQWDVMDGHFVPNLTVGPDVIAACRSATGIPFEVHLMIEQPERWLRHYVEAGCEIVIVHAEACKHLHKTLEEISSLGARPGVALNPATPVEHVVHVLDLTNLVLVMTVNPGFGGQSYIASMEPKIAATRKLIEQSGRDIWLEVDGGIAPATVGRASSAGADRFVIGSALFRKGGPRETTRALKSALGLDGEKGGEG
jgi:ribulose-phosphate 3-epimerase